MAKILLVEDNEMNRDMLSRRLQKRGFDVEVAVDGAEGVASAREQRPDLILMDMSLPGLDGWEATRRIKADAGLAGTPVIALTAHAMEGDREKALEEYRKFKPRICPNVQYWKLCQIDKRGETRPLPGLPSRSGGYAG